MRRTKTERIKGRRDSRFSTFGKQAAHQERMGSQKPKEARVSRRRQMLPRDGMRQEESGQFTAQVGPRKPRCHF